MNEKRRQFLKFLGVGAVAFTVGKMFQSIPEMLHGAEDLSAKNAKFADNGKQITIYGTDGKEILVIDKDSFQ